MTNPFRALRALFGNVDRSSQKLAEITDGVANMTQMLDQRLGHVAAALESSAGSQRLSAQATEAILQHIQDGIANLTEVTNRRIDEAISSGRHGDEGAKQAMMEIRDGVANLASDVNRRLDEAISSGKQGDKEARQALMEIRDGVSNFATDVNRHLSTKPNTSSQADIPCAQGESAEESPPRIASLPASTASQSERSTSVRRPPQP